MLLQLIKSGDELLSESDVLMSATNKNKINLFIFYPEVPPILFKDTNLNEE